MATPTRRYHHGSLRAALLRAAVEMIAESGAGDVSLRQVARQANVSHAAPYRHFADKAALLDAVAEEGFVAMARAIGEAVENVVGSLPRLGAAARAYVAFAAGHPGHYRVMFGPDTDRPRAGGPRGAGLVALEQLLGMVREAQRSGALRDGPARTAALAIWAHVHGLALLLLGGRLGVLSDAPQDAIVDDSMDLLLHGMAR